MRIITLVLLSLLCFSAGAQQKTEEKNRLDSMQYLNEVTVIGGKLNEVIPSQHLKGEGLERLNTHSVADALRYFSGIQIKDYGGIGGLKTVDIRSLGANQVGVFYDGIQIGNAQNGQVDLGRFSLDNIEEISLYNGQKSEIFQPAKDFGASGSVYLRTRRPRFSNGKTYNLKAVLKAGSFDQINPSVLWEQKITNNVSSSLNVEYMNASGRYKFRTRAMQNGVLVQDTTGMRKDGDIEAFRVEGALNGWINQGKWNAKVYYYDSERGIPEPIVQNAKMGHQRQWDRNFFAQGTFQKYLHEKYELMFNLKYGNDYARYKDLDPYSENGEKRGNTYKQQEFYVSMAHKYTIVPEWDIALSADYQRNSMDANLPDFVYPVRHTVLASLATRFEYKRIRVLSSVLGTYVKDRLNRTRDGVPSYSEEDRVTPAVFVYYQPFRDYDFSLRAFYKHVFRMPTFNDLYYTETGNVALKPEYTTQYDLGFQWNVLKNHRRLDLKLNADVYYNRVTDKIVITPKGTTLHRFMMGNVGKAKIRGVDVNLQSGYRFASDLQTKLNLNYTYQEAQDYSDPTHNDPYAGTYKGQIAYVPWNNGSAIVSVLYKSWDVNYSFIYVGERYTDSSNIPDDRIQPWYTSDFSIGKSFRYKQMRCKLTAELNNVFNQQYEVITCYPMPGTNFRFVLKVDI